MRWRNPEKELPKDDQMVWVMLEPHKHRGSLLKSSPSIEIVCGEVMLQNGSKKCIVDNFDELGMGSVCWVLKGESDVYQTKAIAWLPLEEMSYPDWIK